MMILVWIMAAIGVCVVGYFVMGILHEVQRTARQGYRIATAMCRCHYDPVRKPPLKMWWHCARQDFFNFYSETIVGPFRLPYNPKDRPRKYY